MKKSALIRFLQESLFSLMLRGCAGFGGFILTLFVARHWGATESGKFFLALSVVTVLAIVFRIGLDQVVVRLIAVARKQAEWGKIKEIHKITTTVVLLVSVIGAFIFFRASGWISFVVFGKPELAAVLDVMIWASIPFALYMLYGHLFLGMGANTLFQFSQGLGLPYLLVGFLSVGVYVNENLTLGWLSGAYVVASILLLLVFQAIWGFSFSRGGGEPFSIDRKEIWSAAVPLWGVMLLNMILQWAGPVFLGVLASNEDVAIFSVAYRTALLTSLILMAVNSIVAPKFAVYYHGRNLEGLRALVVWSTRLMLLVSVPVIAVFLSCPEWVMGLFGEEFSGGAQVLVILSLGQLVNVATGSVGWLLSMSGREKELLVSTVFSGFLMVVMCLLLIPRYGAKGAAVAQSIALSVQMLVNTYFVKRSLGFVPLNIFARG